MHPLVIFEQMPLGVHQHELIRGEEKSTIPVCAGHAVGFAEYVVQASVDKVRVRSLSSLVSRNHHKPPIHLHTHQLKRTLNNSFMLKHTPPVELE